MKVQDWQQALRVRCPRCFASPKAKCRSLETGKPKRWPHPPRIRAYDQTKDRYDHRVA